MTLEHGTDWRASRGGVTTGREDAFQYLGRSACRPKRTRTAGVHPRGGPDGDEPPRAGLQREAGDRDPGRRPTDAGHPGLSARLGPGVHRAAPGAVQPAPNRKRVFSTASVGPGGSAEEQRRSASAPSDIESRLSASGRPMPSSVSPSRLLLCPLKTVQQPSGHGASYSRPPPGAVLQIVSHRSGQARRSARRRYISPSSSAMRTRSAVLATPSLALICVQVLATVLYPTPRAAAVSASSSRASAWLRIQLATPRRKREKPHDLVRRSWGSACLRWGGTGA